MYVQLVHRMYVLMVYCKHILIGAEKWLVLIKIQMHLIAYLQKMVLEVIDEQVCWKGDPPLLDVHSYLPHCKVQGIQHKESITNTFIMDTQAVL